MPAGDWDQVMNSMGAASGQVRDSRCGRDWKQAREDKDFILM